MTYAETAASFMGPVVQTFYSIFSPEALDTKIELGGITDEQIRLYENQLRSFADNLASTLRHRENDWAFKNGGPSIRTSDRITMR